MDQWSTDATQWLASEQAGQEDAAEQTFAQAFKALARVEAPAGFADRTIRAVWAAERQRRRSAHWAQGVAALLVTAIGLAIGDVAMGDAGGWVAATAAATLSTGVLGVISVVNTGVGWWLVVARVGEGVGTALAVPQHAAQLLALELIGMVALLGLLRLIPGEGVLVNSVEGRT